MPKKGGNDVNESPNFSPMKVIKLLDEVNSLWTQHVGGPRPISVPHPSFDKVFELLPTQSHESVPFCTLI